MKDEAVRKRRYEGRAKKNGRLNTINRLSNGTNTTFPDILRSETSKISDSVRNPAKYDKTE
jgi:hypothetical protein